MDGIVAKWLVLLTVIAGAAVAAPEPQSWRGYEVPAYSVERREGDFEIRRTAPHLVAEVTLRGSRDATLRQGFRTLAGFIFGKNEADAKVAMTAPVTQSPGTRIAMTAPVTQQGDGDLWTVRFAMPSSYRTDTLPRPTNDAIRIIEAPGERVAALRFSGWGLLGRWDRKAQELLAWLSSEGLEPAGPARHLYYDDPLTPPWRRRNEVVIPLK